MGGGHRRDLIRGSEGGRPGRASTLSGCPRIHVTGWSGLLAALTIALLAASFAVASPAKAAEDSTPPQITAFSLTPSEINTESADQTLTLTMTLTDDLSGVASQSDPYTHGAVFVRLSPVGGTQMVDIAVRRVSGDALNGVYTGTAVVPKGSMGGTWRVTWLMLVDMLGNRVDLDWQALEAKFGVGCASVTNSATASDSAPPQITAFSLTPSEINTESADQTLTLTMTLTDDRSGVASQSDPYTHGAVFVRLSPLIGTQMVDIAVHRVSGDGLNGVYTGTAVVPKGSKEGLWRVSPLVLVDMLGNSAYLDADALNALLPSAEGLVIANTAQAQKVTIEREWTISTAHTSVTFPAGTVVTRRDDGRFAFYQMTSVDFTIDSSTPSIGLDGVPLAGLQLGIPGMNLVFDRPVGVSIVVGSQYNGYRLLIQSLAEGGVAWANETTCDVVDGRCHFTVTHATRFVANLTRSGVIKPGITKLSPTSAKRGATVTITGKNFGAKRGTSVVKFGTKTCTKYVSWSTTRIKCKVPAKAKFGSLKVTVKTKSGTSNAKSFKVKH